MCPSSATAPALKPRKPGTWLFVHSDSYETLTYHPNSEKSEREQNNHHCHLKRKNQGLAQPPAGPAFPSLWATQPHSLWSRPSFPLTGVVVSSLISGSFTFIQRSAVTGIPTCPPLGLSAASGLPAPGWAERQEAGEPRSKASALGWPANGWSQRRPSGWAQCGGQSLGPQGHTRLSRRRGPGLPGKGREGRGERREGPGQEQTRPGREGSSAAG